MNAQYFFFTLKIFNKYVIYMKQNKNKHVSKILYTFFFWNLGVRPIIHYKQKQDML